MKKTSNSRLYSYFVTTIVIAFLLSFSNTGLSQCSNFGSQYPSGTQTISCPSSLVTVETCCYGGEYSVYSVTSGNTYTWTTCSGSSFDTELTLWNSSHTTAYEYNDDDCGLQSTIEWTATFTGTVHLLLSEYSCSSNNTCMPIQWSCSSPPTGGCSNFAMQYPSGTLSTISPVLSLVDNCCYGGDYSIYNVISGQTYTWTTCSGSNFDTQLTLWNSSHSTMYAFNDDDCGYQSTIVWTATFTGTVHLLLSQYNCQTNAICMTLEWACTSCSGSSDPDLIGTVLTASTFMLDAGGTIDYTTEVENIGNGNAGSSRAGYYLSPDCAWDSSDIFLASDSIGPLSSGDVSLESETVTIPANTSTGLYYVLYMADDLLDVVESNENNNGVCGQITVFGGCSNFVSQNPAGTLSSTSSTLSTVSSCNFAGDYSVYNVTLGETYTWTTCGDTIFDTQLTLWDNTHTTVYALNDDDCDLQSTIEWTATFTGTVHLLLSEFDCISNSICMPIQWACLSCIVLDPDLTPSILSLSTDLIYPGGIIDLTTEIVNIGNVVADSSSAGYFLSLDCIWDSTDTFLGADYLVALSPGGISPESQTITIPLSTAFGSYYILYVADYLFDVSEGDENNNVVCSQISVVNTPPTASFSASLTNICEGDCISFNDESLISPTSWLWTFTGASQNTSTLQNPVNICYNAAGTYSVSLIATNLNGSDTLTIASYITVDSPPVADFSVSSTMISEADCINFMDQSTGNPTDWTWSFTGGSPVMSALHNPVNICYYGQGLYDVSLTASNSCGVGTETKTAYITVIPAEPVADFMSSATNICVGDYVDFYDQTLNSPTNWVWTFTGATPISSTIQNPETIYYNVPGTYDVSLVVSNAGGTDTIVKTSYIVVEAAPTADFASQDSMIVESDCIDFMDLSTGNPTNWSWSFIGGTPAGSSSQNPVNICYNTMGDYEVSLTASNSCGSDTKTMEYFIVVIEGIEEIEFINDLVIFPNPNTGEFVVELNISKVADLEIRLLDVIGQEIFVENLEQYSGAFHKNIDVGNHASGIYTLLLTSEESTISRKIVIE